MNGCVYRTTDDKCEFYSDHGKGIVSYCDFDDCEEKKPSNADRIREMSDEELAEFFAQQEYRKPVFDGWLPLCNYVMGPRTCHENGCEKCWLEWLKQEIKEDDG